METKERRPASRQNREPAPRNNTTGEAGSRPIRRRAEAVGVSAGRRPWARWQAATSNIVGISGAAHREMKLLALVAVGNN